MLTGEGRDKTELTCVLGLSPSIAIDFGSAGLHVEVATGRSDDHLDHGKEDALRRYQPLAGR